jgi:NAD(P)-dependent dehydrogenase (short-subunit alcohol dehydrogenase family)
LDTHVADATREDDVDRAVGAVAARHGKIDAYVHAVGSIFLRNAHLTSLADWQRVLETNLTSAFLGLKAVLGPMQAQGSGAVVLLSSAAAQAGLPGHEAIAAAKAGIDGLVRSAAATYASRGIRVNAVAPGLVDTPLAAPLLASEQARAFSEKMHPLGRVGRADDIASLIAWLVSAEGSWATGQVWSVDGGLAHLRPRPKD